MSERIHLSPT